MWRDCARCKTCIFVQTVTIASTGESGTTSAWTACTPRLFTLPEVNKQNEARLASLAPGRSELSAQESQARRLPSNLATQSAWLGSTLGSSDSSRRSIFPNFVDPLLAFDFAASSISPPARPKSIRPLSLHSDLKAGRVTSSKQSPRPLWFRVQTSPALPSRPRQKILALDASTHEGFISGRAHRFTPHTPRQSNTRTAFPQSAHLSLLLANFDHLLSFTCLVHTRPLDCGYTILALDRTHIR